MLVFLCLCVYSLIFFTSSYLWLFKFPLSAIIALIYWIVLCLFTSLSCNIDLHETRSRPILSTTTLRLCYDVHSVAHHLCGDLRSVLRLWSVMIQVAEAGWRAGCGRHGEQCSGKSKSATAAAARKAVRSAPKAKYGNAHANVVTEPLSPC